MAEVVEDVGFAAESAADIKLFGKWCVGPSSSLCVEYVCPSLTRPLIDRWTHHVRT